MHTRRAMEPLEQLISKSEIERLRSTYDSNVFLTANRRAFATAYPPLAVFAEAAGSLLSAETPIEPKVRELCLITLLAYRSPGLSLATHVYWGLMEGVTLQQVCHAASFAGCYGGLPQLATSLLAINRTLLVLKRLANESTVRGSEAVLTALAHEFAGVDV